MKSFRDVLEKVERFNRRERLFARNDSVVLALSGGPDSSALLHVFSRLARKYGLRLRAAHLNHGLSSVAGRFESAVRRACKAERVPLRVRRVDVKRLARAGGRSIEEAGRVARYSFLESVARSTRSEKIVTAHTLDDQAETVLMRVVRGTGLRGLAGIPARRPQGRHEVIRPFLSLTKAEIERMLREERVRFVTDPSNRQAIYTRNWVRLRVLPSLARLNPDVRGALSALGSAAADAQELVEREAARAVRSCVSGGSRRVAVRLAPFRRLPGAVRREVLLEALRRAGLAGGRLSREHVESLLELARSGERGLEVHLPGGIVASLTGRGGAVIILKPTKGRSCRESKSDPTSLWKRRSNGSRKRSSAKAS